MGLYIYPVTKSRARSLFRRKISLRESWSEVEGSCGFRGRETRAARCAARTTKNIFAEGEFTAAAATVKKSLTVREGYRPRVVDHELVRMGALDATDTDTLEDIPSLTASGAQPAF